MYLHVHVPVTMNGLPLRRCNRIECYLRSIDLDNVPLDTAADVSRDKGATIIQSAVTFHLKCCL